MGQQQTTINKTQINNHRHLVPGGWGNVGVENEDCSIFHREEKDTSGYLEKKRGRKKKGEKDQKKVSSFGGLVPSS